MIEWKDDAVEAAEIEYWKGAHSPSLDSMRAALDAAVTAQGLTFERLEAEINAAVDKMAPLFWNGAIGSAAEELERLGAHAEASAVRNLYK